MLLRPRARVACGREASILLSRRASLDSRRARGALDVIGSLESIEASDNEIDSNHIVEQAGHDQNQDARKQSNERFSGNIRHSVLLPSVDTEVEDYARDRL